MNTSFERTKTGKEEWLTPPEIIRSLGVFDTDPCAPTQRPWSTAAEHFTVEDDGLSRKWYGRVWLNPPYGRKTAAWLSQMAEHRHGTVLIFARTETKMFEKYIWNVADAILFLYGRLRFYNVDGTIAENSAGAPSCLAAYGWDDMWKLQHSGLAGKFVYLLNRPYELKMAQYPQEMVKNPTLSPSRKE